MLPIIQYKRSNSEINNPNQKIFKHKHIVQKGIPKNVLKNRIQKRTKHWAELKKKTSKQFKKSF